MASVPICAVIILCILLDLYQGSLNVDAEVFLVVMEDESVISYKKSGDDALKYKEKVITRHDIFLESLLPADSYSKLYSYTHLFNGFALHTTSREALEVLHSAQGIRIIHEDVKMVKMTTHSPEYLGLPTRVWPSLGGPDMAGDGVVIGLIDTGINPNHPSFANLKPGPPSDIRKFRGKCESAAHEFPLNACNGKIVGAQYFARAAIASGDFNASHDFASPFDSDGHGSHTAAIAAGNFRIPVISNNFSYGFASGMAPGAHIAIYKAIYSFGGYMSDVVAAVDKAVEDGVDILSLSIGPSAVPTGPAAFLNILEMELLFAVKAGVLVVQAVGNGGPTPSSVLSFSPWITSVAASTTDRKYNNSIVFGNGQVFTGTALSLPTQEGLFLPLAAAEDVCNWNETCILARNCQRPEPFNRSLIRGKLIVCTFSDFIFSPTSVDSIVSTAQKIGAAGFVVIMARGRSSEFLNETTSTLNLPLPGIVLSSREASEAFWDYYDSHTLRTKNEVVVNFGACARILDGRHAVYTGKGPSVASYSSRGPDVNNALMQTADVLKPNILAPGTSIWSAWSPTSQSDQYNIGQDFAILSGTSMATPHVAGVAALIKQKHRHWSPAMITSALMTSAMLTDRSGELLSAQVRDGLIPATPFDYGAGFINPSHALNPGLVFDAKFRQYIQFLCVVPGVDDESVQRAVGIGCPTVRSDWCSDLNTASITVSNLVGSRQVIRKVTSVGSTEERYQVVVREPAGVAVTVNPQAFTIQPDSSMILKIMLEGREIANDYTFGELVFNGDKNHVVKVPLAIFVSSTL
ncbi:Peptidase S8 subtilisin-related protein [Dioscorea alata]|uniref:Peptidase S8 subtilisin-related protein n=1 Tax=Dioscorea alata TaxID=55571 RepID=A0ACB7UG52_DIOAL|nr:Peptidase S8 subtilisin-related protein [Dioscorea alata]